MNLLVVAKPKVKLPKDWGFKQNKIQHNIVRSFFFLPCAKIMFEGPSFFVCFACVLKHERVSTRFENCSSCVARGINWGRSFN